MTSERRRNLLRTVLGNQTLMTCEINHNNRITDNNNQENTKLEYSGSMATGSAGLSRLVSGKIFLWRSGATLRIILA